MKLWSYVALIGAGLCAAIASILLKRAASLASPTFTPTMLIAGFAAVVTYGIGFILYGLSLRTLSLSTAYVSMVAIAVLTLLIYTALCGEPLRIKDVIGAFVVVAGVFIINWRSVSH